MKWKAHFATCTAPARSQQAGQRPPSASEEVKQELGKQYGHAIVSRLGPSPPAARACQL